MKCGDVIRVTSPHPFRCVIPFVVLYFCISTSHYTRQCVNRCAVDIYLVCSVLAHTTPTLHPTTPPSHHAEGVVWCSVGVVSVVILHHLNHLIISLIQSCGVVCSRFRIFIACYRSRGRRRRRSQARYTCARSGPRRCWHTRWWSCRQGTSS